MGDELRVGEGFDLCLRVPAEFVAVQDGGGDLSTGGRMKLLRPARRRHTATAGRRIFLLACCVAPISLLLARSGAGQSTSDTAPVYEQGGAPIEARLQDLM